MDSDREGVQRVSGYPLKPAQIRSEGAIYNPQRLCQRLITMSTCILGMVMYWSSFVKPKFLTLQLHNLYPLYHIVLCTSKQGPMRQPGGRVGGTASLKVGTHCQTTAPAFQACLPLSFL